MRACARAYGRTRELINRVQNLRKNADFEVSQRIGITFATDDETATAIKTHGAYIAAETLALSCVREAEMPEGADLDLNGHTCRVRVARA